MGRDEEYLKEMAERDEMIALIKMLEAKGVDVERNLKDLLETLDQKGGE